MKVLKAVVVVVVLAIVAVAIYDGIQPTLAERDTRSAAADVASAAAHKLFTERDDPKDFSLKSNDAHTAALSMAKQTGVTLTKFSIDANNVVHVTVSKQAKSLVIKHIQPLRHLDEITVSASATPG